MLGALFADPPLMFSALAQLPVWPSYQVPHIRKSFPNPGYTMYRLFEFRHICATDTGRFVKLPGTAVHVPELLPSPKTCVYQMLPLSPAWNDSRSRQD